MSKRYIHYLFDSREGGERGHSLLELMVVIALISVMLLIGAPQIQAQFYERKLEHAARQFIYHAQFARQRALYGGHDMLLKPIVANDDEANWKLGWQVEGIGANDSTVIVASIFCLPILRFSPKALSIHILGKARFALILQVRPNQNMVALLPIV